MSAGSGFDQLGSDPQPLTQATDAALDDEGGAQCATDLLYRLRSRPLIRVD